MDLDLKGEAALQENEEEDFSKRVSLNRFRVLKSTLSLQTTRDWAVAEDTEQNIPGRGGWALPLGSMFEWKLRNLGFSLKSLLRH